MAVDDCIALVIETAGVQQEDAISIMDTLLQKKSKLENRYSGTDLDLKLEEFARQIGEAEVHAARQKRKTAIRDLVLRPRYDALIEAFESQGLDTGEAIVASLVGTHKGVKGARVSVDIATATHEQHWIGEIVSRIEADAPHAMKLLRKDADFRRDVVREMFEIEDAKVPATGNRAAFTLATILSDVNRRAWNRVRRAGADVGELKNWLPQSHDPAKLIKTDATTWTKDILPLLDLEKSFGEIDIHTIQNEILPGIYQKIVSDIKAPTGRVTSLERRHRELFFKDADSLLSYSDQYGNPDFMHSILSHLRENARTVATMETMGSNPQAFLSNWLIIKQEKIWERTDITDAEKQALANKLKNIDLASPNDPVSIAFQIATGRVDTPHNPTFASIASNMRGIVCLAKLGGAAISSISDIPIAASRLRVQGKGLFESYLGMLGGLFEGKTPSQKKEIAYALGAGFDGLMGDVYTRFTPEDQFSGRMTKTLNNYFKLTGLTFMTERQRQTFSLMTSAHMAQRSKSAWTDLSERYRHNLEIHGLDARLWAAVQTLEKKAADGRDYIIPQAARTLSDADVDKYMGHEIAALKKSYAETDSQAQFQGHLQAIREKGRTEIEDRLARYFVDETDYAVLRPDGRTRMWQTAGMKRGTVLGEALRFMWQFKSFSLAFTQRVIGSHLYGGPNRSSDFGGLAQIVAGCMLFGGLAMTSKDISRGREPRDFTNPNTWIAAFVQGGGAGIYGDFIFSTQNRFGQGIADTMIGPVIGTTFDLANMGLDALHGNPPSSARMLSIAKNNTPYMNLWFMRAALDYLIFYQLQEWASPGSLRRVERRLKKDYGQEMILPPSTYIKRGGGWG